MRVKIILLLLLLGTIQSVFSQVYPTFGPEIKVTINGLNHDAMEPFISTDGNTIYFNSSNSEDTTNLYYASRVNDSTFTYHGLVGGIYDTSANHLDAVASMDTSNNFFWTSLRDFPFIYETLSRGINVNDSITNITKVYGDFNIYIPGWIVMDAAINYEGDLLYYTNAFFDTCALGVPCVGRMGVAQKVNDSIFMKLPTTDLTFSNINDTNYIVYAPQITQDGLELYYTRLAHSTVNTEICVSVRTSTSEVFSIPTVIHSNLGLTPEAASPTTDKQKIYYHQRSSLGLFELILRYRIGTTSIPEFQSKIQLTVSPNPTEGVFTVDPPNSTEKFEIEVYSLLGELLLKNSNESIINITHFRKGTYLIKLRQNNTVYTSTIQKL